MSAAQFSIQLELRCSFWWVCVRRAYSLMLAVVLFFIEWPLIAQMLLLTVLILAVVHTEKHPVQANMLQLGPKGSLFVRALPDGVEWLEAEQVKPVFVHPWMTIFSATFPRAEVRYWLVLPDACSADDFRRLRVWLQWESGREVMDTVA